VWTKVHPTAWRTPVVEGDGHDGVFPLSTSDCPPSKVSLPRLLIWFAAGLVAIGLIAFAYAHVSERIKSQGGFPLGLGAIGFGGIAGLALGYGARRMRVVQTRVVVALSWILIAGGQVACTLEAYRLGVVQLKAEFRKDPLGGVSEKFLAESPTDDAETKAAREKFRADFNQKEEVRRERVQFSTYLTHRVRALGKFTVSWAAALWAAELVLGTSIGAWIAYRLLATEIAPID